MAKARGKQKNLVPLSASRAGEWIIKNGKFYDTKKRRYIIRCRSCGKLFYATRVDARACRNACKVAAYRAGQMAAAQRVDALFD